VIQAKRDLDKTVSCFLTEQGYEYEIYTLDQFQETGLLSEADRFPAQAISEPAISGV
jgi:hypothetical protein